MRNNIFYNHRANPAKRQWADVVSVYKEQAPDTSFIKPGETLEEFANRMYTYGISRLMMAAAITDGYVYQADDILRRDLSEADELRQGMMRHYWRFTDRLAQLVVAPEDYIDDMREKALKRLNRKMQALVNAIDKDFKKIGIEKHECCARVCAYINFCVVAKEAYKASVRPLGKVLQRSLPDYVIRALDVLDMSKDYANKILKVCDPNGLQEEHEANATILKFTEELLDKMCSQEEMERAASYAKQCQEKLNKKGNKE